MTQSSGIGCGLSVVLSRVLLSRLEWLSVLVCLVPHERTETASIWHMRVCERMSMMAQSQHESVVGVSGEINVCAEVVLG